MSHGKNEHLKKMNWQNILTGISEGRFHTLIVRDSSGNFQDILTLIAASSSSGISNVLASSPLSVATSGSVRTLSIDLGSYSTTAQVQERVLTTVYAKLQARLKWAFRCACQAGWRRARGQRDVK